MSRIGKNPIEIPSGVEVKIENAIISVKGPLGELSRSFNDQEVEIKKEDNIISLTPTRNSKSTHALWGTYASHVRNMIEGTTKGFEKKLVIEGVGFRAQMEGASLVLNLGFSHPVKVGVPEGMKVVVEKNILSISGVDKEKVGDFSAKIRALKKPEPYKGKGIRFENEVVRRKAGKKAATTA